MYVSESLSTLSDLVASGDISLQRPALLAVLAGPLTAALTLAIGCRSRRAAMYTAILCTCGLAWSAPLFAYLNSSALPALHAEGASSAARVTAEQFRALWVAPLQFVFSAAAGAYVTTALRAALKATEAEREACEMRERIADVQTGVARSKAAGQKAAKARSDVIADVTEEVVVAATPTTTDPVPRRKL